MNADLQKRRPTPSPAVDARRRASPTRAGFRLTNSWLRLVVLLLVLIGHAAVLRVVPPLVWTDSEMAIDDASRDSRSNSVASRIIGHRPEKS